MNVDEPDDANDVRRTVTILNQRGLHARAAAKFVKCAEMFDCQLTVARQDMVVSGLSIMGLMMLAAAPGTDIELRAKGREADDAINAVAALIAGHFDED